jgi:imidazolonepropionase
MLIYNIRGLVVAPAAFQKWVRGIALDTLTILESAWLAIEEDKIIDFGTMDTCPVYHTEQYDASGRFVLPSWCDSHTHIVFAGSREQEFLDKIKGIPYQEIAKRGGGILNSALRVQQTDEAELYDVAYQRVQEVMQLGTGALEIKSGYGLSTAAELKLLRVIRRLKEQFPLPIKATFLGAHTVPSLYQHDRQGYINLLLHEMLPQIADEGLADYIDVFCEKVAFSADETQQIIEAGERYNLKAKIHSNQFYSIGGVELCVAKNALSIDHLEVMTENEIVILAQSDTIATLLPSAPFFLNDINVPPARQLLQQDAIVALASDYNPGSSPSGNMNFVISLACIRLRMTPNEAINAATINGAAAMELQDDYGSLHKGKIANLIVTKPIPSLAYLPYKFGENLIEKVMLKGKWR